MAEKKFGLGTALLIGAAAAAVAGGVVSYIKRAEIKRLAEDIITRVKPADDTDEEIGDWDIRADAAQADAPADTAEPNIVDSGLSLESVEAPAEDAAGDEPAAGAENEPEAEAQPEPEAADDDASEAAEESTETAGEQPEPEAEADTEAEEPEVEQPKKKTWFWSK